MTRTLSLQCPKNCKNAFQLARITCDTCTCLQSQPSSCCCRPSLIGEKRRCTSLRALHNELLSHRRQKHKFKFSSSNREETTKQNGWKSSHASQHPAVEDGTMPAPSSVRLKASSNAAVGLFICASHNACRTALYLSLTTSVAVSFLVCPAVSHQNPSLAFVAQFKRCLYNLYHSSPPMPLYMAWQMECYSSSTSSGLHQVSPTFVVLMRVR